MVAAPFACPSRLGISLNGPVGWMPSGKIIPGDSRVLTRAFLEVGSAFGKRNLQFDLPMCETACEQRDSTLPFSFDVASLR